MLRNIFIKIKDKILYNNSMRKKQGFTLIELLVVIGVIGVLATLVFAAIGTSRSRAQEARIISNMRQLRLVIEQEKGDAANYAQAISQAAAGAAGPIGLDFIEIFADQGGFDQYFVLLADEGDPDENPPVPPEMPNDYCITVQLITSDKYLCIDDQEGPVDTRDHCVTDPTTGVFANCQDLK